jgi:FkbM family methyltransferase
MLDIGANVGRTAIPRAILGDVTGAYCAEAAPDNYACLKRNVTGNGLRGMVMPNHVAISDRDGTVRLHRSPKYTGHRAHSHSQTTTVIDVPCRTLDSWIAYCEIDLNAVTFIKVDVEGGEQQVLDGAGNALSHRHIAWQVEVWAPQLRAAGGSAIRCAATLVPHFTHFVDLRRDIGGPRTQPIAELPALADALHRSDGKTDLVLFTADDAA